MTTSDLEIYRLEEIRDEITDLMDEAKAIVAGSDDYLIDERANLTWIKNIRELLSSKSNIITMSTTINELWEDWYEIDHTGEDK